MFILDLEEENGRISKKMFYSLMYDSSRLKSISLLELTDLPLVLIFHCRETMVSGWHLWRIGAELLKPLYIFLGE